MRYVVIMAGGAGTRLWPLSRRGMPKQLLDLFDGKSLLRLAYERLIGLLPAEQILVCAGRAYGDVVREQIPELPPENLLGEPVGRDSLNAVGWSAALLADRDPDAVVAMVTADHLIEPIDAFHEALDQAFLVAEREDRALVLLGVVPTEPHTGFGYLHRGLAIPGLGACRVNQFKEKPGLELAKEYLASGEYWWNSGMSVWRAATMMEQLAVLVPETYEGVLRIVTEPRVIDDVYPTLPKTSFDYAIMERVADGQTDAFVAAVPLEISWRDVGGFAALAEALGAGEGSNAGSGPRVELDSSGCLVINTTDQVVATLGLSNVAVVVTAEAVLVADLADTERVKEIVAVVSEKFGADKA